MELEQLKAPFALNQLEKEAILLNHLTHLTEHHAKHCDEYRHYLVNNALNQTCQSIEELPYLPVQLFKFLNLKSITNQEVFRVLHSSGTTGQQPSKIFLDQSSAALQPKVLLSIVSQFIGKQRLPMLILDHQSVVSALGMTARSAAILGFSHFGCQHTYLLANDTLEPQINVLIDFLEKFSNQPILMFGFTFLVWSCFYEYCAKNNISFDLSHATLIHGGGWKKLAHLNISKSAFKEKLASQFKLTKVYDYYGMVEQIGTVFMECEFGKMHVPFFADVIIRDPWHFQPLKFHQVGLIQVLSLLPKSYPGHSILTEDLGKVIEVDECACGRKGKVIEIIGRLPTAEARGCSDTHQR